MADNPDVQRVQSPRTRHDSVGGEDHVMGGHVYVTVINLMQSFEKVIIDKAVVTVIGVIAVTG